VKYLLLIYEDENLARHRPEADTKAVYDAYIAYTQALKEAGVLIAGDALQGISTATTVRVRQGKTTMTDGPFAETKEQLGGYYLIDVPDLDAALKWAERLPSAKTGSVEVRPLFDYEV
jgi:hypothetical protein